MNLQVLKRSERIKLRAVAQQFYEKRPGMDATANGGAAEGVAMEGNDRSGKTCSSRLKPL